MGRGWTKVFAFVLAQLFREHGRTRLGGGQRGQDKNERLQARAARSTTRRGS
jgi:hypothetical protein